MQKPEYPRNEKERLEEVYRYEILDSGQEEDFQQLVNLASAICEAPMSLVTIVDSDRQWFKAKNGVEIDETSRDVSFCSHAILDDEAFIIEDTYEDNRFYDNPLVTKDPNIRFYAGIPLVSSQGYPLGTLCVLDSKPKKLSASQLNALDILASQVMKLIELRYKNKLAKESAEALKKKNQELNALNDLNNQITSIISHDMRGPVASILSYLKSKDFEKLSSEEVKDLYLIVTRSLTSIHDLIENLLEWSQKHHTFKPKKISIYPILGDLFQLTENQLKEKNIELNLEIPIDLKVEADHEMIRFIFRNLISNAIKYTENGSINVKAKELEDSIQFTVEDSGQGISENILDRLRKGDKKITTSGTRKEKGTGLGLQLIRQFLEFHNSDLQIESTLGKGSAFSFQLKK